MMSRRAEVRSGRSSLSFELLEPRMLLAVDPSAAEQEMMQLTNRFRVDPQNEFPRWMISASPIQARDPDVDATLKFFNVNGAVVQQEWQALQPQPPFAWSEAIQTAATTHNNLMRSANLQSHQLPGEPRLRDRLLAAGFAGGGIGENVFAHAKSIPHAVASYVFDWGTGANGLQDGRPHRVLITRAIYNRAGMAITTGPGVGDGINVGPIINTQDFGELSNVPPMVVGAVFEDRNASSWYEAGEGIGGVQLTFEGAAGKFTTAAFSAGGYQIELPAGTYRATASGGGLRFPVVAQNVIVSDKNVWLNFLYDPSAVPPDRFEPNDSLQQASILQTVDQSISDLSIHSLSDQDYFRIVPNSNGPLAVSLSHANAVGSLNLFVVNSAGTNLAQSTVNADVKSVTLNVLRGESYFVLVQPVAGASNPSYQLQIDVPESRPPLAQMDFVGMETNGGALDISVLANDSDPDGPIGAAAIALQGASAGTFSVPSAGIVRYSAKPGFSGVDRVNYQLTDDQGLVSNVAGINVFVIDFTRDRPFQNSRDPMDANDDGSISAIDVLLVINEINLRNARLLPNSFAGAGGMFGFVDTSGDGFLTALDALLTINLLNSRTVGVGRAGEGEIGIEAVASAAHDQALLGLVFEFKANRSSSLGQNNFDYPRAAKAWTPAQRGAVQLIAATSIVAEFLPRE